METSTPATGPRRNHPRAFFGVRHPALRAVLAFVIVAVLALGGYLVYYRHYLKPKKDKEVVSGEYTKKLYERWKRKGERGWERLFAEARKGFPGYSVDVGRPARVVLAEVGAEIRPFIEGKLRTSDFAGRMTVIQVLAETGEPTANVVELLKNELAGAANRREEVAVLKCANALPEPGLVLMHVSFAALESPNAKTRYMAASSLVELAQKEGAPSELAARVNDLRGNGKMSTRIDFAVAAHKREPRAAYEMLLEGLASDDAQALAVAASHTTALRDADRLVETMTPEQRASAIADDRTFLNMEIAMLDADAALEAGETPRETYALLLQVFDHEDAQLVTTAANHVAAIRGEGAITYETTPEQRVELIEAHRAWLEAQLAEPEAPAGEAAETDVEEEAADEEPVEDTAEGEDETESDPDKARASYMARVVSEAIVCDECGETTTGLEIPFSDCGRFHTCPKCGKKKGRPLVYYVCLNPNCTKALVKVRNNVFQDGVFSASQDAVKCPVCGRKDMIGPNELSIEDAKKIAEETGQEFP